jgi:hypothetical protein
MTTPIHVHHFAAVRRCMHGVAMVEKRRFRGPTYWEADECPGCEAIRQKEMDDADAEMAEMAARIKARREEEA